MRTKETVVALLALVFVYGLIAHCTGCIDAYKPEIAAAGYQAQQMRCVEQYADKEHIDACRERVRTAWASRDAGSDAEAGK